MFNIFILNNDQFWTTTTDRVNPFQRTASDTEASRTIYNGIEDISFNKLREHRAHLTAHRVSLEFKNSGESTERMRVCEWMSASGA